MGFTFAVLQPAGNFHSNDMLIFWHHLSAFYKVFLLDRILSQSQHCLRFLKALPYALIEV